MLLPTANHPYKIVNVNLIRGQMFIKNLTDCKVYIKTYEDEVDNFISNGYILNLNEELKIDGYRGSVYAVTDTAATEVRLIEFNIQAV